MARTLHFTANGGSASKRTPSIVPIARPPRRRPVCPLGFPVLQRPAMSRKAVMLSVATGFHFLELRPRPARRRSRRRCSRPACPPLFVAIDLIAAGHVHLAGPFHPALLEFLDGQVLGDTQGRGGRLVVRLALPQRLEESHRGFRPVLFEQEEHDGGALLVEPPHAVTASRVLLLLEEGPELVELAGDRVPPTLAASS